MLFGYNIIVILISILVPLFVLVKPLKEKQKIEECKFELIAYVALVVGFLIRLLSLNMVPNGLNVDEASAGYEAYSILHYGIDRTGHSLPVFLEAWGSGQNALLTYLTIPFVALFGLSVITTRLPMAIIGCASLVVMYFLIKNIFKNKKIATLGLAFLAICPWHIMKSRWGLESNLFPDMILLSTLLVVLSIQNKKDYLMYIAFAIIGLTSYAYGTSYFFLPIYVTLTLGYLLWKKELTWKKAIISFSIAFVIAIPIVIFIFINTFDFPEISILGFSVPRLIVNRYEEVTGIFSSGFIQNCINNFAGAVNILVVQHDDLPWSQLPAYGLTYLISTGFTILGLVISIRKYKDNKFNTLMNIWGLTGLLLLFICEPNVNRINIIWFPYIYYTIIGLYEVIVKFPEVKEVLAGAYIIYFMLFTISFAKVDFDDYVTFTDNVQDVIEYVDSTDAENIYVAYSFKEPYIYYLFYTKYNPHDFNNTAQYFKEGATFENVKAYGRYKFYIPEQMESGLLVLPNNVKYENETPVKKFKRFNVYEVK